MYACFMVNLYGNHMSKNLLKRRKRKKYVEIKNKTKPFTPIFNLVLAEYSKFILRVLIEVEQFVYFILVFFFRFASSSKMCVCMYVSEI